MPKDEFDFEDPFELNGMAFATHEDTSDSMAECFIEEFMRLGYGHKQLLALFRNPQYLGPNLVYQKRGEPFVRDLIVEVFSRWGRGIAWNDGASQPSEPLRATHASPDSMESTLLDPMGNPVPKLNS